MRNSTLSQVVETKADFWKYFSIYSQTIQDTHKKKIKTQIYFLN